TVLIPEENVKDLAEIPETVKNKLEIIPVSHVDQVLEHALVDLPEPIEWTEADDLASQPGAQHLPASVATDSPTAH
ncbi:MAG: S16 family serine protease, partial [Erythrobacter sp.]